MDRGTTLRFGGGGEGALLMNRCWGWGAQDTFRTNS